MSIRIGRLRIVDLLLFAAGASQVALLFVSSMRVPEAGDGYPYVTLWGSGSFFRFVALATGALALAVLPLALGRGSSASALSAAVFLAPLSVLNLLCLSIAALAPRWAFGGLGGGADITEPYLLILVNAALLVIISWSSLRSESRGIKPDPSPEATTFGLNDAQSDS